MRGDERESLSACSASVLCGPMTLLPRMAPSRRAYSVLLLSTLLTSPVALTTASWAHAQDVPAATTTATSADDSSAPPAPAAAPRVFVYAPASTPAGYADGEAPPIPPGYHYESSVPWKLVIAGAIVFGAAFTLSCAAGVSSSDERLCIPLIGPLHGRAPGDVVGRLRSFDR